MAVFAAACSDDPVAESAPSTTAAAITSEELTTTVAPTSTSPSTTTVPAAAVAELGTLELATSPDGRFGYVVDYQHVAVPRGEPIGFNGVISIVDDTGSKRPALNDDRDEFDDIVEMSFGPDNLVTWTSIDANYGAEIFLGRSGADGVILDAHQLDAGSSVQLGRGVTFDAAGRLVLPAGDTVVLHDPMTDPFFAMTSGRELNVDRTAPLAPVLEELGSWLVDQPGFWYLGDTLGAEPACGGKTLYRDDPDGLHRVLASGTELDRVVDVETTLGEAAAGADTAGAARAIVLSTECPGEYDGRRVYAGVEIIGYGDGGPRREMPLRVTLVDIGEVADVLSVEVQRDADFGSIIGLEIEIQTMAGAGRVVEFDPWARPDS